LKYHQQDAGKRQIPTALPYKEQSLFYLQEASHLKWLGLWLIHGKLRLILNPSEAL
jgi:hypothetical protein